MVWNVKIKVDKIKSVKRLSREENRIPNKSGPHTDKKEKKKSTKDYLEELENMDGY